VKDIRNKQSKADSLHFQVNQIKQHLHCEKVKNASLKKTNGNLRAERETILYTTALYGPVCGAHLGRSSGDLRRKATHYCTVPVPTIELLASRLDYVRT